MAAPALLTYLDFQEHPMFIAPSEFSGQTQVANIVLNTQKAILKDLLGAALYAEFDADYDTINNVFLTQKWIDFVDGYTYQEGDITVVWEGAKNMLKGFVFFEYQKYNLIKQSQLGSVIPNIQNAVQSTIYTNEIDCYNKAVDLYGFDWKYRFFGKYRHLRWLINYPERWPTAYNFLMHRESEFENWNFKEKYKINEFGI